MGIYYSSISKRTVTLDGVEFAYSNFHGKQPGMFSDPCPAWERFLTRAENTAYAMKDKVRFVIYCVPGKLGRTGEHMIARWNGEELLHDGFWDNQYVGKLLKDNGRWHVEWRVDRSEDDEEEWTPENADYCDVGSIHHY